MSDQEDRPAPAGQENPPAAPGATDGVEYEYVDEDGNPVSPPPEGIGSDEYEIVEESPAAVAPAAPADRPAQKPPAPSTRRLPDRKSARASSRPAPAPARPHSRVKAYLLLGMFLSVPLLMIAIAVVYYIRFVRKDSSAPQKIYRANPYEEAKTLKEKTTEVLRQANHFWEQGNEAEAERLYQQCRGDFERARVLIVNYRKEFPGEGYEYMDRTSGEMLTLLRHVNERLFQAEMRRMNKNRPPPPPAPEPSPGGKPPDGGEKEPPANEPPDGGTPDEKPAGN